MLRGGFFTLDRCIFSHPVLRKNANRFAIWVWLIGNAQYEDHEHLELGQVWASVRFLSEELNIPKSTVGDILKLFEREGMIRRGSGQHSDTLTVVQYETWQFKNRDARTATGQQPDSDRTNRNKKQETRNKKEPPVVPLELDSPRFRDLFGQWVAEHRKTVRAQKMALKKMEPWGVDEACEALTNSLANSWKGVFKPDGRRQSADEANARTIAEVAASLAAVDELRQVDAEGHRVLMGPTDDGHPSPGSTDDDRQLDLFEQVVPDDR